MFLPKTDIFKELEAEAVDEISAIAEEETYEEGTILFEPGDPVAHFLVLVEGELEVAMGKFIPKKYVASKLGESVAWCTLVGIDECLSRIKCSKRSTVLKIAREDIDRILEAHPRSGLSFYRHLAGDIAGQLVGLHRYVSV